MGKYETRKRRSVSSRTFIMLLALVLVIGVAAGGTVAWLTAKTDNVVNTFTTSDVDITLTEEAGGQKREFKMVPGYTITKDPKVAVIKDSEKCYLFVKLEKSENFDDFLTYTVADGWTQGNTTNELPENVYYRIVDASSSDQAFDVIKDNQVTVKDAVTKSMMNGLTVATYPKLTVTAYASQFSKDGTDDFTPAEAWANVNTTSVTP